MAIDFSRFQALTFDCYGTLIDWERGIVRAFREMVGPRTSEAVSDAQILERFGTLEAAAERGAYRSYRAILTDVAMGLAGGIGASVDARRAGAFAASVSDWPPFDDSVDALAALRTRYRLVVVSNVDDDLFAGSARRLGNPFEHVVTAAQVRSYKPAHAHFHEALARLDLPPHEVLHVAQSLYHDIAPANELGLTSVWVSRRAGRAGGGATHPARARPDLEVPDLRSLVRAAGLARGPA